MRIAVDSFRGEAPRLTPRALPPNAAQQAVNSRLVTGDLEAWRQFAIEQALENTGPVQTIYKLNDAWLSWDEDVDVARGAVAGDTTFRAFLTGPEVYDRPQWTNYSLATTGAAPYPVTTRPLGVPPPDSVPAVQPGVDPNPSSFSIDILDEGNVLATQWSIPAPVNEATFNANVIQDSTVGNPQPSYRLSWRDQENGPYLRRNFGIGDANAVTMTFDWRVNEVADRSRFWAAVQRSEAGEGISVQVDQGAADQWVLSIGTGGSWGQGQYQNTLISSAVITGGLLLPDTFYRLVITVIANADGTRTVTATIRTLLDVDIVSVTTSVTTASGDWCGFGSGFDQLGDTSLAYLDNIRVQATGSTGYNPLNTATNYLYTFVNDLGEESAPSFASVTVLRPDGVSVTVTTPTDVPTGVSSDWGITTKRIYRAVTGATGSFYRFVAEISLATADYVDALPDTELGEVLQSELWALPPVDMRGMLALPNGVMAGFSKNQLCLSAQNHPHAWPVEYRLTVDTDIVAIGAIDTTIVVCTKNFIYLAVGTDPSRYSMSKLEVPQACVSKRSLAYLIGIGVVFASPDGLIAVAGNGNVRNLTSSVFTREQWQALVPESIIGVAHDDVYHLFYDSDVPALYYLDTFTGPADQALSDHAPNVAPEGMAYNPPFSGIGLVLNGDGSLTQNEAQSGNFNASNEAPDDFEPLVLGENWTFEIHSTVTNGTSEGGPATLTTISLLEDLNGLGFSHSAGEGGTSFANLASDFGASWSEFFPDGLSRFRFEVSPTGITIYRNDVLVTTIEVDMSGFTAFVRVAFEITGTVGGASIQQIAVYPEGTP